MAGSFIEPSPAPISKKQFFGSSRRARRFGRHEFGEFVQVEAA